MEKKASSSFGQLVGSGWVLAMVVVEQTLPSMLLRGRGGGAGGEAENPAVFCVRITPHCCSSTS